MTPAVRALATKKKPTIYSDFEVAKRRLSEAIEAGPFYGLLLGPSGTGKTSLLRELSETLDRHRYQVLYLAHCHASSPGIGRFLMESLRLSPRRTQQESLRALAQALRNLPFRIVLFLDDADLFSEAALQEARLVAESELDSPLLFTVVYSGLVDLKRKLESPTLFSLKRRLTLRVELCGLKDDEVAPFLLERLGAQEATRIPKEALGALFERARGIPAVLETLSRRCLAEAGKEPLSLEKILEVLESCEIL